MQVGRAGRSGQPGWAHLFLNDVDFRKLHSLSHSDELLPSQIEELLQTIFENAAEAPYVLLPIKKTIAELDMKEEVIDTIISYLDVSIPSLAK